MYQQNLKKDFAYTQIWFHENYQFIDDQHLYNPYYRNGLLNSYLKTLIIHSNNDTYKASKFWWLGNKNVNHCHILILHLNHVYID